MWIEATDLKVLIIASVCAFGLSGTASAAEKASRDSAAAARAAATQSPEDREVARAIEEEEAAETVCRPIRRLGGKVRIARRGADCDS